MSSTFLRKRTFIFAEDEEEDVRAFPPSPSKRRSTLVVPSQLQPSGFDLKPIAAPNFSIFADHRDAEGPAAVADNIQAPTAPTTPTPDGDDISSPADSSIASAVTSATALALGATSSSSSSATTKTPLPSSSLKMKLNHTAAADEPITPPRTPTRKTTRTTSKLTVFCDNDDDAENNIGNSPLPVAVGPASSGTPRRSRRSGLLTPLESSSPSPSSSSSALNVSKGNNSNSSNQSTGLTPAMNKMMRPSKDVVDANAKATKAKKTGKNSQSEQDENANDENSTPSTTQQGYSTPKRLQRTKSLQNVPLSSNNNQGKSNSIASSRATSPSLSNGSAPATTPVSTTLGYYQDAKALFRRTTEPHRLVGRAAERETIRAFCQNHILKAKAGSLYISGQPGTGKTALLKEVMRDMEAEMQETEHEIKTIMINCMTIKDPRLVYSKMLEEMGYTAESKDKDTVIKTLEALVLENKKKSTMFVAILDEIDQLLTKDQEVLYKLFQWSTTEGSRLTLVGIANALDMTDRFLPRLKARNCEPQLLNFNPYQVAEIRDIIMDRLFSVENSSAKAGDRDENGKLRVAPLMQRPAIELCARKVAAATGDLRKALDICRQTIEMVEVETKKKERMERQQQGRPLAPLSEIRMADLENRAAGGADRATLVRRSTTGSVADLAGTSIAQDPSAPVTLQDAPKVTVAHVQKALASAFGSPMVQKMKGLNVHQQIILAVLVMKIQSGKTVDCEVGKVFDHFTATCRSSNKIGALSRGEYQDLINMLEATGLITLSKAKEDRLRKIGLVPREGEVLDAIKGQDILETIAAKAGLKTNVAAAL
ncbi:AAA ATPase [Mortierella sp. GBA35]|nr:AAA ATPase [Mortierella sp. GBA35]KAG0214385.1 AAA ATPase [Mortierella sp. NVP41]